MWNPIKTIKEKLTGAAPEPASADAAKAAQAGKKGSESPASMEDLEKQGLMGKFFRHWKNPKLIRQLQAVAQRMHAEGVNVKDRKAVEEWLKAHQKEIESGEFEKAAEAAKPQTFVKTGPDVGRNDPCACGSGKKFKKCCGAKA